MKKACILLLMFAYLNSYASDIEAIKDKHPGYFKDIPKEFHDVVAKALEKTGKLLFQEQWEEELKSSPDTLTKGTKQAVLTSFWEFLADSLGLKATRPPRGVYQFFSSEDLMKGTYPEGITNLMVIKSNYDKQKSAGNEDSARAWKEKAINLYKIHLMPKINKTAFLLKLIKAIKQDPDLQQTINQFKIRTDDKILPSGDGYVPIVVIYVGTKDAAQTALNSLYKHFKNEPGLDLQPRYNAKVTDLIWIAQGNADDKKALKSYQSLTRDPHLIEKYYETKNMVYINPGLFDDYHLKHPETGKDLYKEPK